MTIQPISPNGGSGAELARYERPSAALARLESPALDSWIPIVAEVAHFADYIATTEFVPGSLRGKPAAITAAIIAGRELGLGPMASMKHVQIVEGTPALSAEMGRALVQAHGHKIRFREISGERCVIEGRRSDDTEWTTVTFTMQDARDGGLLEPGKSGKMRQGWVRWKRRMLVARASSELCHTVFADCLNGMAIIDTLDDEATDRAAASTTDAYGGRLDEVLDANPPMADGSPEHGRLHDAIAAATSADDLNRIAGEIAAAERDGLAEPTVAELRAEMTARAGELPAGQKALKRMHTALTALGITDREQKLAAVGNVVKRVIESTSKLTGAEADDVWRRAGKAMEDGGAAALLYPAGEEPQAPPADDDDYVDERSPEEIAAASGGTP